MKIHVIRTDGKEEHYVWKFADIRKLIGADTLDTVNLRDGRVMMVDDNGYETRTVMHPQGVAELVPVRAKKPFNAKATSLYWKVCKPGTTQAIVGDVAIVLDAECDE